MNYKKITIRQTRTISFSDFNSIMEVEKLAFGYDKEAELVADLLGDRSAKPTVSLLAFDHEEAIGHILFTCAHFHEKDDPSMMHILAPLAVKLAYQKQGIGGMLINEGLRILQEMGSKMVFVLGHKDYYPKYGFIPNAQKYGFEPPYAIPEEFADCWMMHPLNNDIHGVGTIKCANALNKPAHWRDEEADRSLKQ